MSRFIATIGRGALGLALVVSASTAVPAAAQTPAQIQAAVDAAYAKYKNNNEGAVADYIPALAKVDPKVFGIAVVTADGKVYTAGDLTTEVSIQSISKVYTMALVMNQQNPDVILNTIGADATGMRFNSIISVEYSYKGLGGSKLANAAEMNPLVNPGAITATSIAITADSLREMGRLHTDAAKAIIGAAVADDVLALLALSVVQQSVKGVLSLELQLLSKAQPKVQLLI